MTSRRGCACRCPRRRGHGSAWVGTDPARPDASRATPSTSRGTGEDGLWLASENPYDVVVLLDVGLPDHRRLRGLPPPCARPTAGCPVLMLTARDAVHDRVTGLDVRRSTTTSPSRSHFVELLARVRSARPTRGRRSAPRSLRVGRPLASTRRPAAFDAWRCRGRADRQGVRAARAVHAPARARSSVASGSSSTRGTSPTTAGPTSWTSTSATYAGKIDRPFRSASSLETVRGAGVPAARRPRCRRRWRLGCRSAGG